MAWGKNGTPSTLTGVADVITISDLTDKKFNVFLTHAISVTGNTQHKFRYNNNNNPVYAETYNVNGGSDNGLISQTSFSPDPTGTNDDKFSVIYNVNITSEEKLSIAFGIAQNASGSGIAPMRIETVHKFVPNPNVNITRIDLINGSAGDFAIGSNLSALGTTGDEVLYKIQNGTVFEETDTNRSYIFNATTSTWVQI